MARVTKTAYNNKTGKYHLVEVDDSGNIVYDLGCLTDREYNSIQMQKQTVQFNTGSVVNPKNLENAQLNVDAYDLTYITNRKSTQLVSTSSQYLAKSTGGQDAFNFQNTNGNNKSIFGFSFWISIQAFTNAQCFVGKQTNNAATNNSTWSLVTGGSGNKANIAMLVWTSASANTSATVTDNGVGTHFPLAVGRRLHIAGCYDGSQAGDNTKVLVVYINGVKMTTSAGATLPAQLQNPSNAGTVLTVGSRFGFDYSDFEMSDLGLFTLSTGWDATDFANLWNNGAGYTWSDLPTTYKNQATGYWILNENGISNRLDSTGNGYTLNQNNSPGQFLRTTEVIDKINGYSFKPQNRVTNTSAFTYNRIAEPEYNADMLGSGSAGWKFPNANSNYSANFGMSAWLYCPVLNWNLNSTGNIFSIIKYTGTIGFETFDLSFANDILDSDTAANNLYLMPGMYFNAGGNVVNLRVRDANNGLNAAINGDFDCYNQAIGTVPASSTSLVVNHKYCREISFINNAPAVSFAQDSGGIRIYVSDNGGAYVQQSVYNHLQADVTGFFNLVTQRTHIGIGGGPCRYSTANGWIGPTNGANSPTVLCGGHYVFGPTISDSLRSKMRDYLLTK